MSSGLPSRAARLLQIAGVNAIPIGGLLVGDWNVATAMLTYWFETLLGTSFAVLRMMTHRRLTRKAGYWFAPLQDEPSAPDAKRKKRARPIRNNYIAEFARTVTVFTLAHGLFLGLITALVLKSPPQWGPLGLGMLGVLGFQGISLGADLLKVRELPFSWARDLARQYLGRVVVVHLAIIGGVCAATYFDRPTSFFAVFGVLKLIVDLAGWLPRGDAQFPETPPRWLVAILERTEPATDPYAEWRAIRETTLARRASWEETMAGKPEGSLR